MKCGRTGLVARKRGLWAGLALVAAWVLIMPGVVSVMDAPLTEDAVKRVAEDATKASCSDAPLGVMESPAFAQARAALVEEPGFVDLQVGHNGVEYVVTALFDAETRGSALPEAPAQIDGVPVEFVADEFVTVPSLEDPQAPDVALQPVPILPCLQGIRPGARMNEPAGCTYNFVYQDNFGRYYIGTAGHCTSSVGDRAATPSVGTFGTVIFRVENGVGADFALVRVDADQVDNVNPEMCHWGGPTGTSGASLILHHYGYGVGFGSTEQTRARTGVLGLTGSDSFAFTGAAIFGDSGSGAVTSQGRAIGTITHIGPGSGTVYGTLADHGIDLAESATGLEFTIVEADFNGLT